MIWVTTRPLPHHRLCWIAIPQYFRVDLRNKTTQEMFNWRGVDGPISSRRRATLPSAVPRSRLGIPSTNIYSYQPSSAYIWEQTLREASIEIYRQLPQSVGELSTHWMAHNIRQSTKENLGHQQTFDRFCTLIFIHTQNWKAKTQWGNIQSSPGSHFLRTRCQPGDSRADFGVPFSAIGRVAIYSIYGSHNGAVQVSEGLQCRTAADTSQSQSTDPRGLVRWCIIYTRRGHRRTVCLRFARMSLLAWSIMIHFGRRYLGQNITTVTIPGDKNESTGVGDDGPERRGSQIVSDLVWFKSPYLIVRNAATNSRNELRWQSIPLAFDSKHHPALEVAEWPIDHWEYTYNEKYGHEEHHMKGIHVLVEGERSTSAVVCWACLLKRMFNEFE